MDSVTFFDARGSSGTQIASGSSRKLYSFAFITRNLPTRHVTVIIRVVEDDHPHHSPASLARITRPHRSPASLARVTRPRHSPSSLARIARPRDSPASLARIARPRDSPPSVRCIARPHRSAASLAFLLLWSLRSLASLTLWSLALDCLFPGFLARNCASSLILLLFLSVYGPGILDNCSL